MEYIPSIIICVILVAVVALIIRKMIKDKKKGKSGCGCGCDACAMKGNCHPKQ
ncbi:MAG: FeoB-associated Cys-rich membrane protein [Clostridia bacterium]|nr:FeoB-associated Cys-rich membrane protein [Clostridia bacterium]